MTDSMALFIRLAERERSKRKACEAGLEREHARNEQREGDLRAALERAKARVGALEIAVRDRALRNKALTDELAAKVKTAPRESQLVAQRDEALAELAKARATFQTDEQAWRQGIAEAERDRNQALDMATASAPDRARDQLLQGAAYELDRVVSGGIALKTPNDALAFCKRLLDTLPDDVKPKKAGAA